MSDSRALARLIGPTMIALGATEALNMEIFAGNAPAVVYFNGSVLFAAGLAIVLAHNLWKPDWRVLLTLTGWIVLTRRPLSNDRASGAASAGFAGLLCHVRRARGDRRVFAP